MTAFGPPSTNEKLDLLTDVQDASTFAVAGVTTVYGKSFTLPKNHSFGLVYRFTGTVVTVKVELEQSNYNLTTAEEGAAHAKWAVGHIIDAAVVATAALAKAVTPVVAKYGRLKLTGSGSNNADVLLVLAELGLSKNM